MPVRVGRPLKDAGGEKMTWEEEMRITLGRIQSTYEFETIFEGMYRHSNSSPRHCAEILKKLTPEDKLVVADEAIRILRNKYPRNLWYYAGD